jgi:flavin reductase (DIM6/NTAB) family NADH-FMN oxidoreductase RutF
MNKLQLTPNTTLYSVPLVLVTCGAGEDVNVFTLNRIASCNAEPPMVSISVRPSRASHDLIDQSGEFVINIPWPDLELVSDFVGTTSCREIDKWQETGLTTEPAAVVAPPLLDACPVNLECRVRHTMRLPSHSLFVAEVVALHALPDVLNGRQEVDFKGAGAGLAYRASVVRERPVDNFRPDELRQKMNRWRDDV